MDGAPETLHLSICETLWSPLFREFQTNIQSVDLLILMKSLSNTPTNHRLRLLNTLFIADNRGKRC